MTIEEQKSKKVRKIAKILSYILLFIALIWFSLVLIELYRVRIDKRPLVCINSIKDIEDDDEYSVTCYGPLYKYREYYYNDTNEISAKEFTLIFKEFDRTPIES